MKFTNEQENTLKAKGRVLVSAAAGSGKTAVLVQRVANMLFDENNPVDADKLLVVTFTKAAANEMRVRINELITQKLALNPNSARLRKQQLLLSKASICTMDSFCINLVRDYFYLLGIPQDFKIISSFANDQIESKAMQKVIDKRFSESSESFLKLIQLLNASENIGPLQDAIFKVSAFLRSLPFPIEFVNQVNSSYQNFDINSKWLDEIFKNSFIYLQSIKSQLKLAIDELKLDIDLYNAYGESMQCTLFKLDELSNYLDEKNWDKVSSCVKNFTKAKIGNIRNYSDEAFKDKMKAAKGAADKVFTDFAKRFFSSFEEIKSDIMICAPCVEVLLEMSLEFINLSLEMKLENGFLDFGDVSHKTLELLVQYDDGEQKPTSIARELSTRFAEVLVDEYQDTNDLQNTIFNALSDSGNKLFMVGDVKQSIYGFRDANPKNFIRFKNELPEFAEGLSKSKVIMSGNFRSASDICFFVNDLFGLCMSENVGQMNYEKEDELVPQLEYEGEQARVILDLLDKEDEKATSLDYAKFVANKIHELIKNKTLVKDGESYRPLEYKDIAVLIRSRKHLDNFELAFKELKIPAWLDKVGGLFGKIEIQILISLLQVIDNPSKEISLISLLMSPIYRFSADEAAKIRLENNNNSYLDALLKFAKENEKGAGFLNEIEEFRQFAVSHSVSELINFIYDKTQILNLVLLQQEGEQSRANLLFLFELAKDYEQDGSRGLSAFVRFLERSIQKNGSLAEASIVNETDNVVKVMTIHRSKGLQFPVCFVGNIFDEFNTMDQTANLQLSSVGGIGFKLVDLDRKIRYSSIAREAISSENERSLIAEELRLLYVAMTRAKDYLYLCGACKDLGKKLSKIQSLLLDYDVKKKFNEYFVLSSKSYSQWILGTALVLKSGKILRDLIQTNLFVLDSKSNFEVNVLKDFEELDDDNQVENKVTELDQDYFEFLKQRLGQKYYYEDINCVAAKQSASLLAHTKTDLRYACSTVPLFLQSSRLSAAQKGTALHKFMQYCDFLDFDDLENQIAKLTTNGFLSVDEAKSLNKKSLQAFFESDLFSRIKKSSYVKKEKNFIVEVPLTQIRPDFDEKFKDEMVVIQGAVDLCFEEDGEIVIIDYKTDRVESVEELREKYSIQLEVYKKAIEISMNKTVKELALYSLHLSEITIL